MSNAWTYTQDTEKLLLKKTYDRHIDKQFNKDNVLFGRMKKRYDFEGEDKAIAIEQSIGGGRSSGSLPTPNRNKTSKAVLTTKKLYASVRVDRESMLAARSNVGAFVRFTEYPVKVAQQGFNSNVERQLMLNDITGSGALFSSTTALVTGAGTAGSPYIVTLNADSIMESVEEGDLLNAGTETTELEVVNVIDGASKQIAVVGSSALLAAQVSVGATTALYMQKSKDNELIGLQGVLKATSGNYKGVAIARRYQAHQKALSGVLALADLNEVIIKMKRKCGETPDVILVNDLIFAKILSLSENQKYYNLPARGEFKAQISFSGIEYIGPDGAIPVIMNRFMPQDEIYFLNTAHIELHARSKPEWFDEDGTVFLRDTDADSYSARYGMYCDVFINPHFQGIMTAVAVA